MTTITKSKKILETELEYYKDLLKRANEAIDGAKSVIIDQGSRLEAQEESIQHLQRALNWAYLGIIGVALSNILTIILL